MDRRYQDAWHDFHTITHSISLVAPTDTGRDIAPRCTVSVCSGGHAHRNSRLFGVRVSCNPALRRFAVTWTETRENQRPVPGTATWALRFPLAVRSAVTLRKDGQGSRSAEHPAPTGR